MHNHASGDEQWNGESITENCAIDLMQMVELEDTTDEIFICCHWLEYKQVLQLVAQIIHVGI